MSDLSHFDETPTSSLIPPPPIKPNTNIKINGNTNVKTTAEGLRVIERKLALLMANIAFTWLYFEEDILM